MSRLSREQMLVQRFDLTFEASGEVVEDVEALCRGVLGSLKWPKYLEEADNVELLATLLGDAVLLERQYQPREGIEARPWLFQRLRWKALDWREVAERHRTLPELPGLDGDDDVDDDGGRARRSGLGGGLADGATAPAPGDSGLSGLDALVRRLEGGDSALLREIEALGLSAPPGARGRSARARRALARLERLRVERVARAQIVVERIAA